MDIKILDSWLREYLETPAKPEEIARYLSLSSQSVEKVIPLKGDFLYEIEVTSNRPDAFSVYGIARELAAVLPRYGIKAKLNPILDTEKEIPKIRNGLPLEFKISQSSLVPRFTALIFDQVKIGPSPQKVQFRLEQSGIRALNNVIDISNYLMLELGQPMHTFDYDKIRLGQMTVRQSILDEKIVTLDGQTRNLPVGTIIIEDGEGRIVDLCGIMGAKNSEVDENTKRVLLFVQTYDPISIRRSCQNLSFRTDAASRFEKGVDPEGVMIAMKRAVGLFADWASASVASKVFDLYPDPPKPIKITLKKTNLDRLLGLSLKMAEAKKILEDLGFTVLLNEKEDKLTATVPHWRFGDMAIPEDLIEEIARIYGYQNLPDILPPISFPKASPPGLELEYRLKLLLKHLGFVETPTYSMTSSGPENSLKIANPLSTEWVYLRNSLIPSLKEVVLRNISFPEIKIFEISHIYLPRGENQLPDERPKLVGIISPGEYLEAKGIIEVILEELGIDEKILSEVGTIGQLQIGERSSSYFEIDLLELEKRLVKIRSYQPISRFPAVVEDFSFVFPPKVTVGEVKDLIKEANSLIRKVELLDVHENVRTFRVSYQSFAKNLSALDTEPIRSKILKSLEKKGIYLKK